MKSNSLLINMIAIMLVISLCDGTFATDIGGEIPQSTTWRIDDSPFDVTEDIEIPQNVTVTIEPEVIIDFHDHSISVEGAVVADGDGGEWEIEITNCRLLLVTGDCFFNKCCFYDCCPEEDQWSYNFIVLMGGDCRFSSCYLEGRRYLINEELVTRGGAIYSGASSTFWFTNCSIAFWQRGATVYGSHNDVFFAHNYIEECSSNGLTLDFGGGGNYIFEQNTIFNCAGGGIIIQNRCTPPATISNNVIYNCCDGIVVINDEIWNHFCIPRIFNNAIFNCDNDGMFLSIKRYSFHRTYVKNNICWQNGDDGIQVSFMENEEPVLNADITDIVLVNNVCGYSGNFGISLDKDPGENGITYLALKENIDDDINWTSDRLDASCLVFENGDLFTFVDETPTFNSWDFHASIDDIWAIDANDCQYNNLVATGWLDNLWLDPDGSRADFGVFGGPYAEFNLDSFGHVVPDYCLVTTFEWYYRMFRVWPDTYRITPGLGVWSCNVSFHNDGGGGWPIFEFSEGYGLTVDECFSAEGILFRGQDGGTWDGILFDDPSNIEDCSLVDCVIKDADIGVKLIDCDDTLGDRVTIEGTTIDSCGVGIYANNSRLALTNSTVTRSNDATYSGAGVWLTTCSAGQVEIDNCVIADNGTDGTVYSAGVFLYDSDPEITRTEITGNSGGGICAFASSPDLNTYDFTGGTTRHNDIYENGSSSQYDSDGAEIYLAFSSSPVVKYNNIHDNSGTTFYGYALYNDDYNMVSISAPKNWWGTNYPDTYSSSLFHNGGGTIYYSPWESGAITDEGDDDFEIAMAHWDRGEFADAAEMLAETASDTGMVGVNSVRYLLGCEGELEDGNYLSLRGWLQDLADEHRDARVAKMARRYATHCLTKVGNFEAALEEFDQAREDAECFQDSILAAMDWLAVYELTEAAEVQSAGESIAQRRNHLTSLMKDREGAAMQAGLPSEYSLTEVYPNPFNSFTHLSFALPEAGMVNLSIYDLNGRLIQTLLDGEHIAGTHTAVWDASSQPSGVYLARLEAGGHAASKKLTLVK